MGAVNCEMTFHHPPGFCESVKQCECSCSDGKAISVIQGCRAATSAPSGVCRLELAGMEDLGVDLVLGW